MTGESVVNSMPRECTKAEHVLLIKDRMMEGTTFYAPIRESAPQVVEMKALKYHMWHQIVSLNDDIYSIGGVTCGPN